MLSSEFRVIASKLWISKSTISILVTLLATMKEVKISNFLPELSFDKPMSNSIKIKYFKINYSTLLAVKTLNLFLEVS